LAVPGGSSSEVPPQQPALPASVEHQRRVGAELPRHPTGPHAIKSLLPKLRLVHHASGVAAVKGELVRISGASAQTTVRDSLRLALITTVKMRGHIHR
jgi:hypothetical protein